MVTDNKIREGYKLTEVGVVPSDWELQNILDNSTLKARIGWHGLTTAEYLEYGEYYLVTGTDFVDGRINWDNCSFVDEKRYTQDRNIQTRNGDVLITKDGTIGKIAYVKNFDGKATLNSGVFVIRPKQQDYLPLYFYYLLKSSYFDSFLTKLKAGSTISHLYQRDFSNFKFLVPPLPEQTAIATALSDVDNLITSLNKIINKKINIKQGAMEELLTGKKRLKGFKGEWEVKKLGELGFTFGGLTGKTKSDFDNGTAYYITFMNIMTNVVIDCGTFATVNVSSVESQNLVMKGDMFFNGSSETPQEVGMCSILLDDVQDVYLNSFCFAFRLFSGVFIDGLYLVYYFRSQQGRELMKSLAQGATRYNLSKTALLKVAFPIPSYQEQQAIAQILSDMDTEIQSLEQKRDKYTLLKTGMMQQLLTGKIRLT